MEALCFALLESMLAYILWIRYTLKLEALCLQQYKEIIRKVRVGEKMKQNIKVKPHPMALLLFILYKNPCAIAANVSTAIRGLSNA